MNENSAKKQTLICYIRAPEILTRSGHGKPVDWWSLGALMFDMLTGTVSNIVWINYYEYYNLNVCLPSSPLLVLIIEKKLLKKYLEGNLSCHLMYHLKLKILWENYLK